MLCIWRRPLQSAVTLREGSRSCDTRTQSGTREDFLGTRRSLLSQFLFRPTTLYYEYENLYEGVEIVYDYHYYQMTMRMNNFLYMPNAVKSYWLSKQASE
jgi:hypothetical protein